jgi:3-phenylpropionate/trans-cinnamate dioxygenase ferredoxin component
MQTNPHADVSCSPNQSEVLKDTQFRVDAVPPGSALLVDGIVVFNVAGSFCATQAKCTHRGGPLSEGKLDGSTVTCPWHGSQFNVCTGAVLRGPATEPIKTYRAIVEGNIGSVEKED